MGRAHFPSVSVRANSLQTRTSFFLCVSLRPACLWTKGSNLMLIGRLAGFAGIQKALYCLPCHLSMQPKLRNLICFSPLRRAWVGKILLTIQIRDLHLPALPAEQASLFLCSCAFIVSGQFTYISFTVSSDEKRMRVWSIPDGIHWKHSPPKMKTMYT